MSRQDAPLTFVVDPLASAPGTAAIQATTEVAYQSSGRCLLLGPSDRTLALIDELGTLQPTLVELDPTAGSIERQLLDTGVALYRAPAIRLTGHLGEFVAVLLADGVETDLAVARALDKPGFDLVLDLNPVPLIGARLPPFGYFHASDTPALEAALAALPELVGEFSKPRYFDWQADRCVHQRSQMIACQRCIEVCVAEAIRPDGDGIAVDPYRCQGCGSCATRCPTGAMVYAYPKPADAIAETRRQIDASPTRPSCLLLHTERHEAAVVAAAVPNDWLSLRVEEVSAFGLDYWLAVMCAGISEVILVSEAPEDDPNRLAIEEQARIADALLQGIGRSSPVRLLSPERLAEQVATADARRGAEEPGPEPPGGRFATHNDKRQTIRMALDVLAADASPSPGDHSTELPAGAPFGRVLVDTEACTLCMACVSTCPAGSLLDGRDRPALRQIEANCVQCGLCEQACPESAIQLEPRYRWDSVGARQAETLHEETPFHCVRCHKPFATRRIIDTMLGRLQGHWMFQDEKARRRLTMCEDCRVKDMFEEDPSGMDVHAGGDDKRG